MWPICFAILPKQLETALLQGTPPWSNKCFFDLIPLRGPLFNKPSRLQNAPIRKMPSESGNVNRTKVSLCAKLSKGSLNKDGKNKGFEVLKLLMYSRLWWDVLFWHNKKPWDALAQQKTVGCLVIVDIILILLNSSTTELFGKVFQISIGQSFLDRPVCSLPWECSCPTKITWTSSYLTSIMGQSV